MALKFDVNGFINEVLNELMVELKYAYTNWENEVYRYLRKPFLGYNLKSKVDWEINRESNKIISYLKANTYVLADSYGTGSLMLTDNPGYQKYRSDKNRWNPARTSRAIAGRKSGIYTDIFGRKHKTKGTFEGDNIEGKSFGTAYKIKPTTPSYALQMAEEWLYKTYLPRAYKNAIEQVSFTKYLIES